MVGDTVVRGEVAVEPLPGCSGAIVEEGARLGHRCSSQIWSKSYRGGSDLHGFILVMLLLAVLFLKVPLGCVTPFALVNESAGHVSLLLDQGFRSQECCFFHPLMNDMSISLNSHDLDKFLKSIGKDPTYVDLEVQANPPVGKDQPPDLAFLAPSEAYVLPGLPEKSASIQGHENNHVTLNNKSAAVTAKADKPSNVSKKEKTTNLVKSSSSFIDPEKFVEEILGKASAIVLSEINEENIKQHGEQLGSVVSNSILRHLSLELKNLAVSSFSSFFIIIGD
ncbi:hypothetical protein RJ639_029395 [Escallonia herrerae]|uniref:YbaK/aminoacyl-tRNA synthetase-associated domain-containing protein n=1 Tax=Escallonia herrerae TaxID=1293975 RepID=A0AA88X606_9ASTE|nr:hypothetical protein RJ639_029395 [Escallonia herrerae]